MPSTYNIDNPTFFHQSNGQLDEKEQAILSTLVNPDAPKQHYIDLSESAKQSLLGAMLKSNDIYKRTTYLKPCWFQDKAYQSFVTYLRQYYDRYGALPDKDTMEQELEKTLADNPAKHYYLAQLDVVWNAWEPGLERTEWILDRAAEFGRTQRLRESYSQTLGLLESNKPGKWQQIANILAEATKPIDNKEQRIAYLFDEVDDIPDPTWLIDNTLPTQSLACLVAPSGHFKSFVALDMALSIANGLPFLDKTPTKTGNIVYLAGEGGLGIKPRAKAWSQARGVPLPHNALLLNRATFLTSPAGVQDVLQRIKEAFPNEDSNPALIIVDTLNRHMEGNENDPEDMSAFVKGCGALVEATGATVLIVHHTGRDQARFERGHTALRGACDTMLYLNREKKGGNDLVSLCCYKQKDAEEFHPYYIRKTLVKIAGSDSASLVFSYDKELGADEEEAAEVKKAQDLRELERIEREAIIADAFRLAEEDKAKPIGERGRAISDLCDNDKFLPLNCSKRHGQRLIDSMVERGKLHWHKPEGSSAKIPTRYWAE